MRACELARLLAENAEDTARLLLPNGKRKGHEWVVGDVDGTDGQSLKVCIQGTKAGRWKDFATDESGDLIGLWIASRHVDLHAACKEASEHLGVKEPQLQTFNRAYSKPSRENATAVQDLLRNWLISVRKVSAEAIAAYRIAQKKGALMFPYFRDGDLIAAKYRAVPDKKFWTDADCEPCLFGWQAIDAAARSVVLVEGEIDALTLYDYGRPALSVPFGGGTGDKQAWIEREYDRLAVYDTIYLALDQDLTGQQAVQEIVRRLGRERCKIVTLPRKDANQCRLDDVSAEEIADCFTNARTCDPPSLRRPEEYEQETIDLLQTAPGHEAGIRLPWDVVQDRLILRPGEVSLWFGISGHGKTMVVGHITAHAMRETRACVASLEFRPPNWLKRLVRQISAESSPSVARVKNVFAWLRGRLWLYDCHDVADRKELLETFKYAARRYGVGFFVIDNLAKCGLAEDDYQGQKDFVDRLTAMARDESIHICLVHHSRKTERGESMPPDKFDAKGTGAITDMVDTVMIVWRNKPKEKRIEESAYDEKNTEERTKAKPDCMLVCCKQRNGEDEPSVLLWFDRFSQQYRSRQNAVVKPLAGLDSVPDADAQMM